jgi:hypothetical protein
MKIEETHQQLDGIYDRLIRSIVQRDSGKPIDRSALYAKMRDANEKVIAGNSLAPRPRNGPEMREALERAIARYEQEIGGERTNDPFESIMAAAPIRPEPPAAPAGRARFPKGAAVLSLLGAIGVAAVAVLAMGTLYGDHASEAPALSFTAPISPSLPKGVSAVTDPAKEFVTLRSTTMKPVSTGWTGGAYLTISPEYEAIFSGQKIQVTISARSALENGSNVLFAAYSTAAVGNSGWRRLPLGDEFGDLSFSYDVPQRKGKPGRDFLGMVPDLEGSGRGVDIRSVEIDVVPAG